MDTLFFNLLALSIKILLMWYVISKAGSLNLNKWGWGIFSFFTPFIALLCIHFVSAKEDTDCSTTSSMDWDNNEILDA